MNKVLMIFLCIGLILISLTGCSASSAASVDAGDSIIEMGTSDDAAAAAAAAADAADGAEVSDGSTAADTAGSTASSEATPSSEAAASPEPSANAADTSTASLEFPVLTDTRPEEYKENTFTTLNGDEVTYNMNTRKIVCIFGSHDVVAFGIPLLAYEGTTDITGYESFYDGASALMDSSPFSPEEILSYEPELILVNQRMSAANIEALSKIAPVIPLYTDSTDFAARLTYIGEIFGLQDHAKKLIAYADALRENMVQELKDLGLQDKTLTIYTYMGAISIPPERGWFMNTILFDYAGIKRLPIVEEFMQDESGMAYEAISAEKLKDYEGDMVIYAGFGETSVSTYVSENVGWQALKAVQEDRVGVIDITPYAQNGVILLEKQYGQILDALKVAGQIGENAGN